MRVTIYHNPKCSNSRKCLEIIRSEGHEPTIVEYLEHPLNAEQLKNLISIMRTTASEVVRNKEAEFTQLGLAQLPHDEQGEKQLIGAIVAHPVLLNRPIVVTEKGARLCRPPELVHELL